MYSTSSGNLTCSPTHQLLATGHFCKALFTCNLVSPQIGWKQLKDKSSNCRKLVLYHYTLDQNPNWDFETTSELVKMKLLSKWIRSSLNKVTLAKPFPFVLGKVLRASFFHFWCETFCALNKLASLLKGRFTELKQTTGTVTEVTLGKTTITRVTYQITLQAWVFLRHGFKCSLIYMVLSAMLFW